MRYLLGILVFFTMIMTFSSCETDFELNAPYDETAVIFGFLDLSADTQFFRIQKTFLGDGDALLFALEEDSSTFSNVEATLSWTNAVDQVVGSIALDTMSIDNKETDGIFFAPRQLIYFIPSANMDLNTNFTYHLEVIADGETYTSSTNLVELEDSDFLRPSPASQQPEISFVQSTGLGVNYLDKEVEFKAQPFARRYSLDVVFDYTDVTPTGTNTNSLVFHIGDVITPDAEGGESESKTFNAESWYSFVHNSLGNVPDLTYREIGFIDFQITLAAEDLHNFLSASEPVTDIIQERPQYTNINRGSDGETGIGVFSSRYTIHRNKFLNDVSLEELVCGDITVTDFFCSPNSGQFQCGTNFDCN